MPFRLFHAGQEHICHMLALLEDADAVLFMPRSHFMPGFPSNPNAEDLAR